MEAFCARFSFHWVVRPRREATLVLFGFFDRSNFHPRAKVRALGGFAGNRAAFARLGGRWSAVPDKNNWPKPLKSFRVIASADRRGEDFRAWSVAGRSAVFWELVSVIMSSQLVVIGSAVMTEDFARLNLEGHFFDQRGFKSRSNHSCVVLFKNLSRNFRARRRTHDATR
jgi:hypothetical protein